MTRLVRQRRTLVVVAAVCVAIGMVSGYAYAVAQSANQDYTGCLQDGRIGFVAIGVSPLMTCPPHATQITWSKTGPQGLPGPPGTNGTNGTNVTSTKLNSGDPNCPNGGSQFIAANNDPTYACNGATGPKGDTGPPGPTSLDALQGTPCTVGGSTNILNVSTDPGTGAVTITCTPPLLNLNNSHYSCSGSVCWGYLSGSGLQPGAVVNILDDNGIVVTVTVPASGNIAQTPLNLQLPPCGTPTGGLFYAVSTTGAGAPITSNTATGGCLP
jgi:hypothetical protein